MSAYRDLRMKQQREGGQRESNNVIEEVAPTNILTVEPPMNIINEEAEELPSPSMAESTNKACSSKKHRGPTKLAKVHARTSDERQPIILNAQGQPIGPTEKIVGEFSRFLGTIARNKELAPLDYVAWPSLPTHNAMWEYVLEKYAVPEEGRKWVLESINLSWRVHKCRVKKDYFQDNQMDEERLNNGQNGVPETQMKALVEYWNKDSVMEESRRNKINRQQLQDMHTMGPKSYALMRHRLKQEDPNKEDPSLRMVYKVSRKRDPTKTYKTNGETSRDNIERMDALVSQENEDNNLDPYYEVVDKPDGRTRLYGKGVTKSSLKKKGQSNFILPQEYLHDIQAQVIKQLIEANPQLADMGLVLPQLPQMNGNSCQQVEKSGGESSMHSQKFSNEVHDGSAEEDN